VKRDVATSLEPREREPRSQRPEGDAMSLGEAGRGVHRERGRDEA